MKYLVGFLAGALLVLAVVWGLNAPADVVTPPATGGEARSGNAAEKADLVRIEHVTDNATIASPLEVTGEARGYWYFEASFPVKVTDADGNVLGSGIATAQGEWMTEDFVPFEASVAFTTGTATEGWLVLEKDNPSGDPSRDDALRIPVKF